MPTEVITRPTNEWAATSPTAHIAKVRGQAARITTTVGKLADARREANHVLAR